MAKKNHQSVVILCRMNFVKPNSIYVLQEKRSKLLQSSSFIFVFVFIYFIILIFYRYTFFKFYSEGVDFTVNDPLTHFLLIVQFI